MSGSFSRLARQGSHTSASSSGSFDTSAHNHLFNSVQSLRDISSWRDHIWTYHNERSDRIRTGTIARGTAILTREVMEIHIRQAPDCRSFANCLPVAGLREAAFVGWRQKGNTWPKMG